MSRIGGPLAVVCALACVAAALPARAERAEDASAPAPTAAPAGALTANAAPSAASEPGSSAGSTTPATSPAAGVSVPEGTAGPSASPTAPAPEAPVPEAPVTEAPGPEAPGPEAPGPEAPAAEAPSAAASTHPTAAPIRSPRRAVLLPVEFTVYQSGVGGALETIPEWTQAARDNLASAALAVAKQRADVEIVPLPELTAEEKTALHEHVALARLIVTQGSQLNNKAYKARRADFDRAFGDGLAFLRERTGADFAILLDGAQVKQSGGSIFMQFALAAAGIAMAGGGGTQVVASVLDLEGGDVEWFNSTLGVEVFGIGGKDVRDTSTTQKLLSDLFAPYPNVPALKAD